MFRRAFYTRRVGESPLWFYQWELTCDCALKTNPLIERLCSWSNRPPITIHGPPIIGGQCIVFQLSLANELWIFEPSNSFTLLVSKNAAKLLHSKLFPCHPNSPSSEGSVKPDCMECGQNQRRNLKRGWNLSHTEIKRDRSRIFAESHLFPRSTIYNLQLTKQQRYFQSWLGWGPISCLFVLNIDLIARIQVCMLDTAPKNEKPRKSPSAPPNSLTWNKIKII